MWRKDGEEYEEKVLTSKFRENTASVMVWGCVGWNGPGPLHFCEKNVNATYYRSILKKNLPKTKKQLKLPSDFHFLQDRTPPHTAKLMQAFLKRRKSALFLIPPQVQI